MLFTGSGRHRRRTQTEKAIAVAGVAGVGLAMPLLTATGAHAAPVSTWDKVAECESGGNWSINTGNGFYGGLQFSNSTWKAYGGAQYAAQAHQASKGQQIAVAEKVLASQGPGAWPVCSVKAGLTKGGSAAQVDSDSAASAAGTIQGSKKAGEQDAAQAPVVPVFPGKAGYDEASGKYWYQKDGNWYWTSHEEIYNQFAQTPAATPSTPATPAAPATPEVTIPQAVPVPVPPAAPAPQAAPVQQSTSAVGNTYTVVPGDTLSDIAHDQHLSGGWHKLYDGNRSTVGGNPDLILPGQVLHLG
ncbi:resuscitation-promoting factor protein RpfA [Kitasatospora atroaurantiaca]|uniref:Nucleoid-associated protein YgaU n=1 Tax=Kitasatospora atroaurantiaca TaxID=285545 RepID=A0A561EUF7_9ACTN|nr:transglycosylase family protein [Kitasatospora atroaurantiaca]TWE19211.1 nucleoid-associated protein YgaU [Kitasatospora atroaurantiaca]